MAGGINQIEMVQLAISGSIIKPDSLRLNCNPALTFQFHIVQYLLLHLTIRQTPRHLDKTVSKRGLSMVNMGNNGKVTDIFLFGHFGVILCVIAVI